MIYSNLKKIEYLRFNKKFNLVRSSRIVRIKNVRISCKYDYTFGIPDDELTNLFKKAVKEAIEKKKKAGLPVSRYDNVIKKVYLEYADGRREYV